MKYKFKIVGSTNMEKKLVVIALILLLVVLVKIFLVSPRWERWVQVRERVQVQNRLYHRYLAIYNKRGEVESTYKNNIKTIEAIEKKIFTGNDIHVAAAKLQKVIQSLAEKNNIRIMRTNIEKPVKISGGLYVITLGIFGEARTMKDLNGFLNQMEYYKEKHLHTPRVYLKNARKRISLEIQVFSVAMIS